MLLLSFPYYLFDRTPFPPAVANSGAKWLTFYFSLGNCPCLMGVTLHRDTCEFMSLPPATMAGNRQSMADNPWVPCVKVD